MSEEVRTAYAGMVALPSGTKAWHICRSMELVDCTHASEDGRFFLINKGQGQIRVDSDDIFLTNNEAKETVILLAEYWKDRADYLKTLSP